MPCLQWELFAPSQSLEAVVFGSGRYNEGGSTFSASMGLEDTREAIGKWRVEPVEPVEPFHHGDLRRLNQGKTGNTEIDGENWHHSGNSTVHADFRFAASPKRLRWGRSWLERQRLVLDRRILTEPKIKCLRFESDLMI